jgi:hypothetical protein
VSGRDDILWVLDIGCVMQGYPGRTFFEAVDLVRGTRGGTGQTLRVPARVVMLGPPYPLISPMSRVRI